MCEVRDGNTLKNMDFQKKSTYFLPLSFVFFLP